MKDHVKMGFMEKITLSPFQKYFKFNRFPWKFLTHILLVIFTTYQALAMISLTTSHARSQHQVFKYVLFGSEDESNTVPFYKLEDFMTNIQTVCSTLDNLNDYLLQYAKTDDATYSLEIYYSNFDLVNAQVANVPIPSIADCIKSPFDVFDSQSVKQFLNQITKINIIAENIRVYTQYADLPDQQSCLKWTITLEYDFESYANIEATIGTQNKLCEGDTTQSTFGYNFAFIHITVTVLAVVSLGLAMKYIYAVGKKYIKHKVTYENIQKQLKNQDELLSNQDLDQIRFMDSMKKTDQLSNNNNQNAQNLMNQNTNWEDIGLLSKLKLFNLWLFFSIIGNIVQIIGCLVALLDTYMERSLPIFYYKESIIGFGSMFAWMIMLNYLQYNKNVNLMTTTLQKASSNIFMFLLGVLPFFFGFVFLGQSIFWKYSKFEDTTTTIVTLFSLSNGDIVNETFMDTWAEGVLGQVYLIVFMIMFFTAVQNVFITIIMEGYDDSKKDKKKSYFEGEDENEANKIGEIKQEDTQYLSNAAVPKSDKDMVLNKLKINTRRIKKILDEMDLSYKKVGEINLKREDREYLLRVYHDNLDNLNRNLKFQLTTMGR